MSWQKLGYVHTGTISYRYRTGLIFGTEKVDCSYGSGPLSYQFWDLFTRVRYRIVPKHFALKQAKENLICQQIRVISI